MINVPNLTISVSEDLRAEMDNLSEVNWSDICRKAISEYITQRKNPTPLIDVEIRDSDLTHRSYETGYATLRIELKISNKMNSEITVDRVLCNSKFINHDRYYVAGLANDLNRRVIAPNSSGLFSIHFALPKEKLLDFKDVFDSTFYCGVRCVVFVDGFKNPYNREVKTRIPIDDWKNVVKRALKINQATSKVE